MKILSTKFIKQTDVEYTQNRIHFNFPKEYISDILAYGVMNLEPNKVDNLSVDGEELCVKSYMSLVEGDKESIHTALCSVGNDLVPFAYDVSGKMYCFDKLSNIIVLYNKHTKERITIAKSYNGFKTMIHFK